jgi:H+-translocating NAD(P) transhydrogenase subunit beta
MNIIIELSYLIAALLFVFGIKLLSKPRTAFQGNRLSALGMFLAIVATMLQLEYISLSEILIAVLIGSAIGIILAKKIQMTEMPETVALLNGFGGLASFCVALADYWAKNVENNMPADLQTNISTALGIIIGSVTFTGSVTAFLKLRGLVSGNAFTFSGQHLLNLVLFIIAITSSILLMIQPTDFEWMILVMAIGFMLGVLTVVPIGGADMPVVISLLNSYSGIAACATGFILKNNVLIITGSLVGASGIILTQIMCKAMNRSLMNVLLGGFGNTGSTTVGNNDVHIDIKQVGIEEAAMLFETASSVIIIPGYGLAVAQAQHVVREFCELLEKRGISVKFGIHPVAGRMPGHMNVLLAEANITYDKLVEMEKINDEFSTTDIVLVIGANDVVNPAARTNPQSPIYGMPILNADKARTVIVSKRSMGKGYAGVENELFGYPNTLMLFGDAKDTIAKLVEDLKSDSK